ncbi:M23 family metallopeptidase [Flavobacterium aquicola]|uniref:Peptidase M23-like protein n=1 Tax=Flavobacterium aquicola TaxID=1682742 RepID=A0A3E0E735_9FLAO|nr:M23 family metallopeptidase [Flavobacterium aquicola]REG94072.1 peptidase M23-like protein [Flavobacterium aquicola]
MKFSIFLLLLTTTLFAQTEYPKDYFRSPLDIPLKLSGNFGELRPNHFHAGFDMKTLQKEGLNVYAVADGYVSRIKISTFGNGKTIYIDHPNGFTSVYGHLQKATDSIESYIKKTHYKEQSFEIEMYFKPNQMPVKKGQLIALSGNTGASEGPHLHFEFRDTKTEKIINPIFFGFDALLQDTKRPIVSNLYVYPLDSKTTVNHSQRRIPINLSLQKDGTYLADKIIANGKIGFGITTYDYDDFSFNKNGSFNVDLFNNGKSIFGYQFNTYSFDEMRYINALIDYSFYKKTSQRIQKLFMDPPYNLSIIKADESNGIITVAPNLANVCRLEVSDFYGNKTTIAIPVEYDSLTAVIEKEAVMANYVVKSSKDCFFEQSKNSVFFPAGTFYNDFDLNFKFSSNVLTVHDDTVPAHTNFTISMESDAFDPTKKDKVFIGRISGSGVSYNTTREKNNVYEIRTKTLGQFKLAMDTIPPVIKVLKSVEGKNLDNQKVLQVRISDGLSGIKSYNGYLNGKWILMEYDNKTSLLTYDFNDGIAAAGDNELKVVVVDNVGNSSTFETHFLRNQKL